MALSYVKYTADGSTNNFALTFGYLKKAHISVKKNGVTAAFTWVSSSVINVTAGVINGDIVVVRRTTEKTPLANSNDGAVLTNSVLTTLSTQNIYLSEESLDAANDALANAGVDQSAAAALSASAAAASATATAASATAAAGSATAAATSAASAAAAVVNALLKDGSVAATGDLNLNSHKIVNVTNPVSAQDAATKNYVDTAVGSSAGFETGDYVLTSRTSKGTGWVLINDGTISKAGSGGTTRANADCLELFKHLYTTFSDGLCPVSGGRTGSDATAATNDFNSGKTITMTKMLGRAIVIAGTGAGLTARTLGGIAGAESPSVPLPAHTHTVAGVDSGTGSATGNLLDGSNAQNAGTGFNTFTTSSAGTASPTISVVQPSSFVNVFIHL